MWQKYMVVYISNSVEANDVVCYYIAPGSEIDFTWVKLHFGLKYTVYIVETNLSMWKWT